MSTEPISFLSTIKYENPGSNRDLRIDFMRGVVIFVMIVIHIDIFSLYSLLVQERIGVISGGEGFVILSGLVLGVVHRRKISMNGWENSSKALFNRSFQLYRISIVLIASTLLLHLIPFIDASAITHFHDHYNNKSYPLYPASSAPLQHWISQVLMLRSGPIRRKCWACMSY